jgi:hypothetical protein
MMNTRALCLTAAMFLGALSMGCTGKIEQCNAFIDQANASQNAFTALGAAMLNKDVLAGRVKTIKESVDKVKAVELKDEKLKEFQTRWAAGLEEMANGLDEMTKLDKAQDIDKLNELAKTFETEADKMGKLIDEVNKYCTGS